MNYRIYLPILYTIISVRNSRELANWKNIQKLIYAAVRVPVLTGLILKGLLKSPTKTPILAVTPIYFMGLVWTMKLLKK